MPRKGGRVKRAAIVDEQVGKVAVLMALKAELKAYRKMVEFAESQEKGWPKSMIDMESGIGIHWGGTHSILCQTFREQAYKGEVVTKKVLTCDDCPLGRVYGTCFSQEAEFDSSNAFLLLGGARSWGEWLVAARKCIAQLEEVMSGIESDRLSVALTVPVKRQRKGVHNDNAE